MRVRGATLDVRRRLFSRANLTDDEAQGGGDRHHGPGESHGGVVHCLGRAHDEATADPGGCITHGQTQTSGK